LAEMITTTCIGISFFAYLEQSLIFSIHRSGAGADEKSPAPPLFPH
jgi:hypothetical protein